MTPLSKAKLKLLRSLHQKKFRQREGLFIAPGRKMLEEALASGWEVEWALAVKGEDLPGVPAASAFETDEKTFRELSGQVNPEGVLAVVRLPDGKHFLNLERAAEVPALSGPAFLLDGIRDPGNLGTLIRTADWMGFREMVCSADTADVFNPKVLRSSMGSIFRMRIVYLGEFSAWVAIQAEKVWVADLEGESPDALEMQERPFLLLGNEANGVSPELRDIPGTRRICIPRFGGAESLNVAASGAILAWEMRRARR